MAEEVKKKRTASGELPKEVAEKFTVIPGVGIGKVIFKGRNIQLDQISLAEAEALVKEGFNVLVPKKAPVSTGK